MNISSGESEKIVSGNSGSSIDISKSGWRSLFNSLDQRLSYRPLQDLDGKCRVVPSVEICSKGAIFWQNTLVAQFIGRSPNFSSFQKVARMLWRDRFDMSRIPIWLHLGNVPLELFNQEALCYVASALGDPLYMDRVTASRERIAYAKVCVEIGATDVIPYSIEILMPRGKIVVVTVEIPWMLAKCKHCKIFGHSERFCEKKPKRTEQVWRPVILASANSINQTNAGETAAIMEIVSHSGSKKMGSIDRRATNKPGTEIANLDGTIDKGKGMAVSSGVKGGSQNRFAILADGLDKAEVLRDVTNSSTKASGQDLNENSVEFSGDLLEDVDDVNYDLAGYFLYKTKFNRASTKGLAAVMQAVKPARQGQNGKVIVDDCSFILSVMYGSNDGIPRRMLWTHFQEVSCYYGDVPWMLVGDFNIIMQGDESSGPSGYLTSEIQDFVDCMSGVFVFYHSFDGPYFTWSNRQDTETFVARKLDRVMVNSYWHLFFPSSFMEFLAPAIFDHCAVMVELRKDAFSPPKPFRFFNY
ncbi:hypothetical protein PTKIN_Ptkin07bG0001000 [Pterospermum kingtungense]